MRVLFGLRRAAAAAGAQQLEHDHQYGHADHEAADGGRAAQAPAVHRPRGKNNRGVKMGLRQNRIVVKVGTSTLTNELGQSDLCSFDNLTRVVSDVHNMGYEVILVSSGAIAIGSNRLKMKTRPTAMITVGREHGSGGHYIAKMIAEQLNIQLYDKQIVEGTTLTSGYSREIVDKMDEKPVNFFFSRKIGPYSNSLEENVAEMTFNYINCKAMVRAVSVRRL